MPPVAGTPVVSCPGKPERGGNHHAQIIESPVNVVAVRPRPKNGSIGVVHRSAVAFDANAVAGRDLDLVVGDVGQRRTLSGAGSGTVACV